jgi:hypothetical protein
MGNLFTRMAKGVSGDASISNGPVGTMATGYSIVQAESLDRAVDIAKGYPVLQGGAQVTVYETFEVM